MDNQCNQNGHSPCGPGWARRFIHYQNTLCPDCQKRLVVVEDHGWRVICPECDAHFTLKVEAICTQAGKDIQPRLIELDGQTPQPKEVKPIQSVEEDDGA